MADIRDYNVTADSNTDIAPEGMAPSSVNNAIRAVQGEIAQVLKDDNGTLTTAGTSTAYTLALSTSPASLADGLKFSCTFDEANTGNSTLVVTPSGGSAFASKKIKKFVGSAEVEIVPGDVGANAHHDLEYDSAADGGTGAYILKNPMFPQAIARIRPTSALAQVDFTWPSSVPEIRIAGSVFPATTAATGFAFRISTDNGSSYKSTAGYYTRSLLWHTGATVSAASASPEDAGLLALQHNSILIPIKVSAAIHKGTGSTHPNWSCQAGIFNTADAHRNALLSGYAGASTDVATNVRLFLTSGQNMTTNTVILVEAI